MHNRADEIVAKAKEFDGVRFKHQGRDPALGLDCAGLIIKVAHDLELFTFNTTDYPKRPNARDFRRHMLAAGFTPVAPYEHGDVLRLADPAGPPVHVAIYEVDERGKEWIIHAWAIARKVVRTELTPSIRKHVREAMRYPG